MKPTQGAEDESEFFTLVCVAKETRCNIIYRLEIPKGWKPYAHLYDIAVI